MKPENDKMNYPSDMASFFQWLKLVQLINIVPVTTES